MLRLAVFLALLPTLDAQAVPPAAPPKLELPAPAKPAIPPPSLAYIPPPPSKWDTPLLYSQVALAAGASGATTAAAIAQYQNKSGTTQAAVVSIGAVGLSIVLQRVYQPDMSDRTKKWVTISNFIASGVLAGLTTRDVKNTQTTLKTTTAPR